MLVAPPAAADEHMISAPVGGSEQLECLFACVIDQPDGTCNSPANQAAR